MILFLPCRKQFLGYMTNQEQAPKAVFVSIRKIFALYLSASRDLFFAEYRPGRTGVKNKKCHRIGFVRATYL